MIKNIILFCSNDFFLKYLTYVNSAFSSLILIYFFLLYLSSFLITSFITSINFYLYLFFNLFLLPISTYTPKENENVYHFFSCLLIIEK